MRAVDPYMTECLRLTLVFRTSRTLFSAIPLKTRGGLAIEASGPAHIGMGRVGNWCSGERRDTDTIYDTASRYMFLKYFTAEKCLLPGLMHLI